MWLVMLCWSRARARMGRHVSTSWSSHGAQFLVFSHRLGYWSSGRARCEGAGEPLKADFVVGENHRLLRREVPIKGSLGDPDVSGDIGDAGLMHAVGDKASHRCLLQRLTRACATAQGEHAYLL